MFGKPRLLLPFLFGLLSLFTPVSQEAQLPPECPVPTRPGAVVVHRFYTLQYNEEWEQPDWVAYELAPQEVLGETARRDAFRPDPAVLTGSAELIDYRGSGLDRGHLAPAADMKHTAEAMRDSFYMSNMSPQEPGFNRGIWAQLEKWVRRQVLTEGPLLIVTGPVTRDPVARTIGPNEVAVPGRFYKALLNMNAEEPRAICFLLPNHPSSVPLGNYSLSVNSLEEITGWDLFPSLPDEVEEEIEAVWDPAAWGLEGSGEKLPRFWISRGSRRRHNEECLYYGNTSDGYYTDDEEEGIPCGRCGG